MSGSLPGTWTGTDTPGEMSPAETERGKNIIKRNVGGGFFVLFFFSSKCHQGQRAKIDEEMQHAQLVWQKAGVGIVGAEPCALKSLQTGSPAVGPRRASALCT